MTKEYMMQATLDLDDGFVRCGERLPFAMSKYPAGEMHFNCKVPFGISTVRINMRANRSDDIMTVLLAVDSLRRQGVEQIELFMPYLPYSRQDRVCKAGDSFSLSVMCALLRALHVGLVTYDVHSNVAGVLLDGSAFRPLSNHREVFEFVDSLDLGSKYVVLVAPDAGARKKAESLMEADYSGRFDDVIYANKSRGLGGVVHVESLEGYNLNDRVCIVVDDICDGGRTFNSLGLRLQQSGCREAYLFVSHGIFSQGTTKLLEYYKTIGTTNSFNHNTLVEGVKTFKLNY